MVTETRPVPHRTATTVLWALATGITGLAANVLLILFFALAQPFGPERYEWMWLGSANDVVIVVQFLTFIPVALALRRLLPATPGMRVATVVAVAAMVVVALLQALLVGGFLDFDVQVVLVCATFLGVYAWVFAASSVGHREGTLPRPVTRIGLLIGASYPLGVLVVAPALLFPSGSAAQLVFLGAGGLLGAFGWLALPAWPLVLARLVFGKSTVEETS